MKITFPTDSLDRALVTRRTGFLWLRREHAWAVRADAGTVRADLRSDREWFLEGSGAPCSAVRTDANTRDLARDLERARGWEEAARRERDALRTWLPGDGRRGAPVLPRAELRGRRGAP